MKNEHLKKYFLGRLNLEEMEKIELQIMEDSSLEESLLQTENDLIEDYLENNLTQTDKESFKVNFLITQDRQERVEFLRGLKSKAQRLTGLEANSSSFSEKLQVFLAWRPMALAFGMIVLILCLGIGWRLIFNNSQNGIETELAALNKQDLSNLEEFKNFKTLQLTAGSLRSGSKAKTWSNQELTERVLVRLVLPNAITTAQTFTVKISHNGQVLPTFAQPSYQNQEVRLLLPKSILNQGEYQIMLEKDAEKFSYYFVIQ